MQKIVTEILPPATGINFTKEARDLLIECCIEFISLVSSEANEISEKEAKKTIACDHITKALERLGFVGYVEAVNEAAAEHKEVQKVPPLFFFLSFLFSFLLPFFPSSFLSFFLPFLLPSPLAPSCLLAVWWQTCEC